MSRAERAGGMLIVGAFCLVGTGLSLAGGGAARVLKYTMGEMGHYVGALTGRHPFLRSHGDPTLPGYYLLLVLTGLILLLHAVLRINGWNGFIRGRTLWRWTMFHAVVGLFWSFTVIWPQILIVGVGLVHPGWTVAAAGFVVQFLSAAWAASQASNE